MTADANPSCCTPADLAGTNVLLFITENPAAHRQIDRMTQGIISRTLHAPTVELGLSLAERLRPSVVLVDEDVGKAMGLQVLRALWHNATTRDIPVIFLVAHGSPAQAAALDFGAVLLLEKPLHAATLQACVRAALRHAWEHLEAHRARAQDELTGLLRFPAFLELGRDRLAQCRLERQPAGVVYMILRRLRWLNDHSYVEEADDSIREAAQHLQRVAGADALLCRRWGGVFCWLAAAMEADTLRCHMIDLAVWSHIAVAARGQGDSVHINTAVGGVWRSPEAVAREETEHLLQAGLEVAQRVETQPAGQAHLIDVGSSAA